MAKESLASIVKRRLLGLTYLVVVAGLISLSVAFYNKDFTPTISVTLMTDHTGNQLLTQSDVKERGLIVGSVKKVKSTGDGAQITLNIDPSRAKLIPDNVSAQILPKTLFGEQYVSLILPSVPGAPIQNHAVITQDRTSEALETEKVLGDILPLLTAVKPAELNATLTALATALRGRGTELGQTLVHFDTYLKSLNVDVSPGTSYTSQLVTDLSQLGKVAVEYNNAAPDLLSAIANLTTSAQTVIDKRAGLDAILSAGANTSNIIGSFLADNQSRLITIVDTSATVYAQLNEYAPEFSCMLGGLSQLLDRAKSAIRGGQINLSAQIYIPQTGLGDYVNGNQPKPLTGLGPHCFGLPNSVPVDGKGIFKIPSDFRCLNDGAALTADACGQAAKTSGFDQQAIGSPAENAVVNSVIAATSGTTADKVPGIATLLVAPGLRGETVTVK
ncbi:MAG: MCE family protein [Actinomycetota bacterium]|nr:MCE family protein [Actinomycetota bacterium]